MMLNSEPARRISSYSAYLLGGVAHDCLNWRPIEGGSFNWSYGPRTGIHFTTFVRSLCPKGRMKNTIVLSLHLH